MTDQERHKIRIQAMQDVIDKLSEQSIAGPFHDTGKDDDWRFRAKLARKGQIDADRARISVMIQEEERAAHQQNWPDSIHIPHKVLNEWNLVVGMPAFEPVCVRDRSERYDRYDPRAFVPCVMVDDVNGCVEMVLAVTTTSWKTFSADVEIGTNLAGDLVAIRLADYTL